MTEAFTVRIRVTGGLYSLWLAPAGGMGLSYPCCAAGHATHDEAFTCGSSALAAALRGEKKSSAA